MVGQIHPSHVLPEKLFMRLRSLKAHNLHGDCYKMAAKALDLPVLEQMFAQYNEIQVREGELRHEIYQARHRAYEQLLKEAKSRLSKEQYDKLYMCF